MNLAIVYNPASAEAEVEALRELLAEHGIEAGWFETTEDDPGTGQARQALADGADLVVACGGDGTVRACAEALAGSSGTLAVIPAGTGNLLARNFGIPTDVPGALNTALTGDRTTIDVGVVNDEIFTIMAGAGIDAAIMANTPRAAKNAVGSLAYVATAGREVLQSSPVRGEVSVDGQASYDGPISTVLVANLGRLQAGVDLIPDADPADGTLEVLVLAADSLSDWAKAATAAVSGDERPGTVERAAGSTFTIQLDEPLPYELDGEPRPATTHLTVDVRSRALTVCIPQEQA